MEQKSLKDIEETFFKQEPNENNMEKTSLKELDQQLYGCADILRNSVDESRYRRYILPLVFYAEISGRFEEKLNEKARERGFDNYEEIEDEEHEDKIKEKVRRDAYYELGYFIPEGYSFKDLEKEVDNLAEKIDNTFREFEKHEKNDKFEGILNNNYNDVESFKGEEGDSTLNKLVAKIGKPNYSEISPDIMGEAYMNMVKRFKEEEGGKYFTPIRIVKLMVNLIGDFEEGSYIHDPTVGSAGMLIEAAKHIMENQYEEDLSEKEKLQKVNSEYRFTGQEKNSEIYSLSKMNSVVHGIESELKRGDSLTNPKFVKDGKLEEFNYILANFPFSEKQWKEDTKKRQEKYGDLDWAENGKLPHGNRGDYAFIMHMESHLSEDGSLATIAPQGVLFRNGEQKYRKKMIEEDWVEAIINLPDNIFEATSTSCAILVLNKDKPKEKEGEVLFINADQEDKFYKDTGSDRDLMLDTGVEKVEDIHQKWETIERTSRAVANDEIRENEYNLNIALYVDTTEPQSDIDVSEKLQEYQRLDGNYKELQEQFNTYMNQLNYKGGNDE